MSKSGLRIKHFQNQFDNPYLWSIFSCQFLKLNYFSMHFLFFSEFVFPALEMEQIPGTMCLWWSTRLHLSSEKKKVQNNAIQSVLLRLPLAELPNYEYYQWLEIRAHSVFVKVIRSRWQDTPLQPGRLQWLITGDTITSLLGEGGGGFATSFNLVLKYIIYKTFLLGME